MTDDLKPLIAELEQAKEGSRFWDKVNKDGPGGCWLWTASKNWRGYGQFSIGSRRNGTYTMVKAHRVAWALCGGLMPNGKQLDHLCRVRHCVNPDHMEPVSRRENILRGVSPSAIAARRTHCPRKHPYSGDNLYTRPDGSRECRICKRQSLREFRARRMVYNEI